MRGREVERARHPERGPRPPSGTARSRFVLISTDKAADPISVLGASKRLAELVVQRAAGGPVTLASVRFGNVLGSRGSFLSVLADQVARAEPVTVTHPDVSRFFMTVEEAVGLVLEAAAMAEYAETFVLDMGEPVRDREPGPELRRAAEAAGHRDPVHRPAARREARPRRCSRTPRSGCRSAHSKIWATRRTEPPEDFGLLLSDLYAAADDGDSVPVKGTAPAARPGIRSVRPPGDPRQRRCARIRTASDARASRTAGERVGRRLRCAVADRPARPTAPAVNWQRRPWRVRPCTSRCRRTVGRSAVTDGR